MQQQQRTTARQCAAVKPASLRVGAGVMAAAHKDGLQLVALHDGYPPSMLRLTVVVAVAAAAAPAVALVAAAPAAAEAAVPRIVSVAPAAPAAVVAAVTAVCTLAVAMA